MPSLSQFAQAAYKTVLAPLFDTAVEGFVERFIADEAVGWAFDARRPHRRVLVLVHLDGKVVAECLADQRRQEMETAGRGDGRCGFRLKLPTDIAPERYDALVFEARAGGRRRLLTRIRRFRVEPAPTPAPAAAAPRSPAAGFLERYSKGVLKGWAVDPNHPEEPALVDIFDGERFLGTARAEIDRPRLRASGAPFGARGFEFRAPAGLAVSSERLRGRIAGSRLELRRSRAYDALDPGEGREPREGTGSEARAAAERVLLIVCGAGSADQLELTLASCRAQAGIETAWTHVGPPRRQSAEARTDETQALRDMIAAARWVVFLAPGQTAAPDLSARVARASLGADVLVWDAEGAPPLGPEPDLAIGLGARSNGLAIRARALLDAQGGLAMGLPAGGLAQVEAWASAASLLWATLASPLAAALADAPPASPRSPAAPAPPRWLSLAVWSGWEGEPPEALRSLLAGAAGLDVEILAPAPLAPGARARLGSMLTAAARSLTLRLVQAPAALGEAGLRRAMGEAATGQVVLFCDGRVVLPAGAVAEVAGWAARPGAGGVTVALADEGQAVPLAGLRLADGRAGSAFEPALAGQDRPVAAAPVAFMALSRAALAEIGGLALQPQTDAAADLELGARLRRAGRRCILLGRLQAQAPAALVDRWASAEPDRA